MDTKELIKEIEVNLAENKAVFTSMGVLNGLAGVSLFYYYQNDMDKSMEVLHDAMKGLNDEYKGYDIVADIIDIANLVDFYASQGLLSREEAEGFISSNDTILEELLMESLDENNLNPIAGSLKYANYFVLREKRNPGSYQQLLSKVFEKVQELAREDAKSGGIYWVSTIPRGGKFLVELGIKHGIMGIVDFLVSLYQLKIEENQVYDLIKGAMIFIEAQKNPTGMPVFPFCADEVQKKSSFSFGLVYGDLGIAYGILRVVNFCNMEEYRPLATNLIQEVAKFKDDEGVHVTDANLFYGVLGIASLFQKIKENSDIEGLEETIAYWASKTKEFKSETTAWAGFDTTFNKFDTNAQLSLSHGIAGIGIALMNFQDQSNFDYMHFLGYTF